LNVKEFASKTAAPRKNSFRNKVAWFPSHPLASSEEMRLKDHPRQVLSLSTRRLLLREFAIDEPVRLLTSKASEDLRDRAGLQGRASLYA